MVPVVVVLLLDQPDLVAPVEEGGGGVVGVGVVQVGVVVEAAPGEGTSGTR